MSILKVCVVHTHTHAHTQHTHTLTHTTHHTHTHTRTHTHTHTHTQETLDADDNPLCNQYGEKMVRDIVQFVPLRAFQSKSGANFSLVRIHVSACSVYKVTSCIRRERGEKEEKIERDPYTLVLLLSSPTPLYS